MRAFKKAKWSEWDLDAEIAAIKAYLKGNAVELDAHAQDTGAVADLPIGSTDLTVPSTPVMELQNEDVVEGARKCN
ncbi:hypothetical protein ACOSQ3_031751 [Xanthoceras sorbifolium]